MRARLVARLVIALIAAVATAAVVPALAQAQAPASIAADAALVTRARGIHERVITLDTHDDIDPAYFTAACNYTQRLTTQVNLPKMVEGGLDVSFMIAYTGQGPLTPEGYENAYKVAVSKFDAVHRLTEQIAPTQIGLALTAADVTTIARSGRKVAVIGIENGYPIGTDLARVREFYNRGGRYLSLAHNGHNQLSDSNTGENTNDAPNNGISPLGRQVIAEMNRLGMMIDVSHPSKASMMQAIELSKAPIIASHSSVRALANHSRNMDDEQLLAMKKNGGVVQIVAFANYVKVQPAAARAGGAGAAGGGRGRGGGAATGAAAPAAPAAPVCPVETAPAAVSAAAVSAAAVPAAVPPPPAPGAPARANVKDFVDHIDYAVKLIGIEHVGISSDFDGGGGIDGWNSAAETFNVTLELVRRGYSEQDIARLWSGNLLRVWSEVETVAKTLQAEAR